VLHALAGAPKDACAPPAGAVARALGFLRRNVNADGMLGMQDPDVLEYPNYSTAYALRTLVELGSPTDRPLVEKMRDRLVAEQFGPANGFAESHLAFGGWGFGGKHAPGETGHMDLAHTRRVLDALRAAGGVPPAVFERALVFLRLMQRDPKERRAHPAPLETGAAAKAPRFDGGFFFSPVVLDANKGAVHRDAQGRFHASYATATCDGLLSLLAAGVSKDDPRVRAARGWLLAHERLDHPEGIPKGTPQDWGQAVYYYHLAARAEAYQSLGLTEQLRGRIAGELTTKQRADGSFRNDKNHLMKEDDPLLATALALIALSR
jgi:squalene-hopene/tetraprenyl-beta-curcumene cyclase